MAIPETIAVRYTEEEAEYLSVRPVVRQTFRSDQLLDMILRVTGKDAARIRQILRGGTIVFHDYRYWWTGFDPAEEELHAALAAFPDARPDRPFRPAECTAVIVESGGGASRRAVEITRAEALRKRLFAPAAFWDSLTALGAGESLRYAEYSYERGADIYGLLLTPQHAESLARDAQRTAPRELRSRLGNLTRTARLLFVCPRTRPG